MAGITTLDGANRFLTDYLPRHNARFAVHAADPGLAYLPVPATLDLAQVFCFKHSRVVRPDNTSSFEGQPIQLLATPERQSWVKAHVELHERLDGRRVIVYQGLEVPSQPAPLDTPTQRTRTATAAARPAVPTPLPIRLARPPAASHPWRQYREMTKSQNR